MARNMNSGSSYRALVPCLDTSTIGIIRMPDSQWQLYRLVIASTRTQNASADSPGARLIKRSLLMIVVRTATTLPRLMSR